jgi:hypothetical protein
MVLGAMDWIKMAQDRDKWWALSIRVIKFRIPYNVGKFLSR